jgi:GNAT superfamily N-acetyltransferase
MAAEPNLHYICTPSDSRPVPAPVEFLAVQDFLADEPACLALWDLVGTQFRTRNKFLAIWRCVSFVALHRNAAGVPDALLLVTAAVNWQIDYVVVSPEARGQKLATALVAAATNEAARRGVPYVMLTSSPSLRPLYEACGFRVANTGC